MQYVASAHNDLLGIAAIVIAAALLRRNAVAACGLVVVAALIKLPFAILDCRSSQRCRGVAPDTRARSRSSRAPLPSRGSAPAPAIFKPRRARSGSRLRASAQRCRERRGARSDRGCVLATAPQERGVADADDGSYIASWYVTYGVPYALARRRILGSLLVLMPFAALLLDAKFMRA